MTTAKQMLPALGAAVLVTFESVTVECEVIDVKNSYGKPRLLISPVSGSGEQWVELGRVSLLARDAADVLARQPAGARAIDNAIANAACPHCGLVENAICVHHKSGN